MSSKQLMNMSRISVIIYTIAATILSVRLLLLFIAVLPIDSTSLYTDQFHHYYLGLVILVIATVFTHVRCRDIVIGIGLGLIVDEFMLPLYLVGVWDHGYWSLLGMLPMFIVFLLAPLFYIRKSRSN